MRGTLKPRRPGSDHFVAPNIPGCWVPVLLQIGNVVSNTVTISIAPSGGMCQDPTVPTLNPSSWRPTV